MKFKKLNSGLLAFAATTLLPVCFANAAGFSTSAPIWGAHEAALAGAATPWVSGADSLYFNPAGLTTDKPGMDLTLQLSPILGQLSAPIDVNNDQVTGSSTLSMPAALIFSQALNNGLGYGVGFYTSNGSKSEFDNVALPGSAAGQATLYSNVVSNEVAAGLAYKVSDKLKVGLSYRVVMATASFALNSFLNQSGSQNLNLQVNNAQATSYQNFKLGAQYQLAEKTLLGLTYQSETPLTMPGSFGGSVGGIAAQPVPIDQTTATIRTVLPMMAELGIAQDYENWRALAQYTWIQYSRIGEIPISGNVSAGGGTVPLAAGVNVPARWQDENDLRLAGEYHGYAWPIRFGYILSSRVADPNVTQPVLYAPSLGHTITVGTGTTWAMMGNPLTFDVAGTATRFSGSGGVNAAGTGVDASGNSTRSGTYTTLIYALHLGLNYAF